VELVRMGVGAGLTPADALAVVAASGLGPTRELARSVTADVAAGLTFREAGRRRTAAEPGDAGVARVLALLSDGQRSGAPLGHALGVLATDLRTSQRRRAEERARAVPVKLLFPLVFLALPAFVLLTVAPAVLVAFER
jgi:tight adherence protein C